ncbi:hypothetical protein GX441_07105 [bacterium]|nr:hypothetical protein [bacterium]
MNQPSEKDGLALELELLRAEIFERLYSAMTSEINPRLDRHLAAFVKEWTDDFMSLPDASVSKFMEML